MMGLRIYQAAIAFFYVLASLCLADTPGKFVKLGRHAKDLVVTETMNADGYDLSGSVFSFQNLKSASFFGATLDRVMFDECDLRNASLKNSDLRGASFYVCNVSSANFSGALIHKYSVSRPNDFILSPQQLMSTRSYQEKNLTSCRISGEGAPAYDFSKAKLQGAILDGGSFENSNFEYASISQTEFANCVLPFEELILEDRSGGRRKWLTVTLSGAELTGDVDFGDVTLYRCSFGGIKPHYKFDDATIGKGTTMGALTKEQLYSTTNYKRGVFRDITFKGCDFSGADLSGKNFGGCHFLSCDLSDANFDDAIITDAEFNTSELSPEQFESTWDFKHRSARIESSSQEYFKIQ